VFLLIATTAWVFMGLAVIWGLQLPPVSQVFACAGAALGAFDMYRRPR